MPNLIIFDCDGTLVDSELLCNVALSSELQKDGVLTDPYELLDRYRGLKLANILSSIEEIYKVKLKDDFTAIYRNTVSVLFATELKPCAGVSELLKTLQLPKCVASSGPREKIVHALTVTDLRSYFKDNIFSSYEIQSWKPEPDIFLHAATSMGFSPSECLVVEDSPVGIQAAKAAGMEAVLYSPDNDNQSSLADHTINRMSELTAIVT